MLVNRTNRKAPVLAWIASAILGAWLVSSPANAGPNLVALGNYSDVPYKRAEGRDSFSGNEIVYTFEDPEFDFGRVVVRTTQPKSVARRDLFVGFTGSDLLVHTQPPSPGGRAAGGGGNVQIQELELWLRINGRLRPGATYEWEFEGVAGQEVIENGIPALIPAIWADGEQIGAEVAIKSPDPKDDDKIQRLLIPHGVVTLKQFEKQTGGAWIVLKPTNYGPFFGVQRFSFREVDAASVDSAMPVPIRYIPIRNVLEDEIGAVLQRGTEALKRAKDQEGTWGAGTDLEQRVRVTAAVAGALAELDPSSDDVKQAMQWLAKQTAPRGQFWKLDTLLERLTLLSRFGGISEFGPVIQGDIQTLVAAQLPDGGWTDSTSPAPAGAAVGVSSNHISSINALLALREARFAGAEPEKPAWKRAMQYWTDAQLYDSGFSNKIERYGGVGLPSTSVFTAIGTTALLTCVDMSAGVGNKRCGAYLASAEQLRGASKALEWLNNNFQDELQDYRILDPRFNPFAEPQAMVLLGSACGIAHFNEKNHFQEGAEELLRHFDRDTGLFGVRGPGEPGAQPFTEAPNLSRTTSALYTLGAGAAPTVCQRIIVGDAENHWGEFRGDVQHVVRYLASKRGRPFNWRRTTIDREVRELVEVPITILNVLGPFQWSKEQWNKLREYCLAGGSLVIDISEDAEVQRAAVNAALQETFPEYVLADLPADAALLSVEKDDRADVSGMKALSNGFRWFLFLPKESWSCQWHLHQVGEHRPAFAFMNNLLTYATDGTPPRSSFAASTYAIASVPSKSMTAKRLQIGSALPAYPNLISTMDRLMRSNYRVEVVEPTDAKDADLVWVNVTGSDPPSASDILALTGALKSGKFLLIDVVSGNKDWDEGFRATLKGLTPGITLEALRRIDPVFTGEIPGTQGFDVVEVGFRKALHTRFAKSGRCDLYAIYLQGKQVGVFSAHDLSSGIGYHYFPGCRGIAPQPAREIAMNAFLIAYANKIQASASAAAATKGS